MIELYHGLSRAISYIAAVVTFFLSWAYCAFEYGFLLGFGLGWLPAIFASAIAFIVGRLLWLPLIAVSVWMSYR